MDSRTLSVLAAFAVYLLAMILIGFFYMKRTKNASDFFLGGAASGP